MKNNQSIDERKYRLKYFYLIDIESMINRIQSTRAYKDFNAEKISSIQALFLTIFSEITSANKLFSDYILSCNNPIHLTFFDENTKDTEVLALNALSSISLFHHCILTKYYSLQNANKTIPLSGTNEFMVRSGVIQPLTLDVDNLPDSLMEAKRRSIDKNVHQNSYSRNQHLKERANYYHHFLLDLVAPENENAHRISPVHNAAFAFFLWIAPSVNMFSKSLLNPEESSKNLIKKYQRLLNESKEWCHSSAYLDKILFDICAESSFGFSFITYAADLLNKMGIYSEPNNAFSLKDLDGQSFLNILTYFFNLPITYNRSIFLKYALKAILATNYLNPNFPSNFQNSAGKYMSVTQKPKVIMASESLKLLSDYFHMLSFVTLPMIEDLWFVLTDPVTINMEINLTCFETFIKEYFFNITSDYTLIKKDALSKLNNRSEDFTTLYNKLRMTLNSLLPKKDVITSYSSSANEGVKFLLNYLCNNEFQLQRYKNSDSFFIDKFISTSATTNQRSSYDLERRIFSENHVINIFNFAKTLNVPS